jgi:signal transduction histidine kinase
MEDLPHVFDRFYRGSKTDKTMGSGLGLSIARAVIHSSGGTIDIESTLGRGTLVTIIFPLERVDS